MGRCYFWDSELVSPAAPARANEPMTDEEAIREYVCEHGMTGFLDCPTCQAQVVIVRVDPEAVPPSPATERPGAETTAWVNGINDPAFAADPKCPHCHGQGFTMVTHDFQGNGHAYSKPMTCGCRMTRSGVTLTVSQAIQPPYSPERERAQDTPIDLPWSVENWKCGQWYEDERPWANIVTPAGNPITRKLKREYAERIVAAVNAEAALLALRAQMATARALLRDGSVDGMTVAERANWKAEVRAFLAETGGER